MSEIANGIQKWFFGILILSALLGSPGLYAKSPSPPTHADVVTAKPAKGFATLLLSAKRGKWPIHYCVSPDGKKLVYAFVEDGHQAWGIVDLLKKQSIIRRENALGDNAYGIINILWSPDSADLYAQIGFMDIPYGYWVKWNKATKAFDDPEGRLETLKRMKPSERPDSMWKVVKVNQLSPVWNRAGVKYANELVARKAGVADSELQHTSLWPTENTTSAKSDVLPWKGTLCLFLSNFTGKNKRLYIIDDKKIIDSWPLAAPSGAGLWFLRSPGGEVSAMSLVWAPVSLTELQAKQWKWVSVNLGKMDTVLATYVTREGVILAYIEKGRIMVVQYDPQKLVDKKN